MRRRRRACHHQGDERDATARIAVVGPGAIGATFAAALQEGGRHQLALCARRDPGRLVVERREEAPVELRGPMLTDPAQLEGTVEWIVLAVKAHQVAGASGWLERLGRRGTTIAVLQNGVEHRELVAPVAPEASILPTVDWCTSEMVQPGRIVVSDLVPLLQVPDDAAGHGLAELFAGSFARIEPVPDFRAQAWRKLCYNAVAGLEALALRRAEIFGHAEVRELARRLALECVAVARAEGVDLTEATADEVVANFARVAGTTATRSGGTGTGTSILHDRLAGRELEWDARNGVIQRRGRRHGVPTPVSDVLVPLLIAASGGGPPWSDRPWVGA